jgi:uncharacterized protein
MLFRRRHKRHLFRHLREMLWPSAGWSRTMSYVGHRLKRLPGSPYSIAAGFACGAAISFTPLIGAHFAVGMLIAWLIGANVIAAGIGTVVGNPWTFPFIWYWTYRLGTTILGIEGELGADAFSITRILDDPVNQLRPILIPMTVGSIPTFIVSWIAFYIPLRGIVAGYQSQRRHRIERRARERAGISQVPDKSPESPVG